MTAESNHAETRGGIPGESAVSPIPFRPPFLRDGGVSLVSIRAVKALAEGLSPSHPFRIIVLGEPDEMPGPEYAAKVVGWFRLMAGRADSGRSGDR